MSQKDYTIYMEHIIECINDVERYVGTGQKLFLENDMVRNACLRQLQIMAESCTRLSDDIRNGIPHIDWAQIGGFRNVLVHDYLGNIKLEIVWDVIIHRLPELKSAMVELLKKTKE